MRNRLIELIYKGIDKHQETIENYVVPKQEWLADYLIENGVIVPPCKIGDIVWVYDFMWGLIPCKVDRPYHCFCGQEDSCTFERTFINEDLGKTVFLTKEEAEKHLGGVQE